MPATAHSRLTFVIEVSGPDPLEVTADLLALSNIIGK